MNRRAFFGLLAGLPFLGRLKPSTPRADLMSIRFVRQWNATSDHILSRYACREYDTTLVERFRVGQTIRIRAPKRFEVNADA